MLSKRERENGLNNIVFQSVQMQFILTTFQLMSLWVHCRQSMLLGYLIGCPNAMK